MTEWQHWWKISFIAILARQRRKLSRSNVR